MQDNASTALEELSSSLAVAIAISLAEWESVLDKGMSKEEAGERALVLLSLFRALEEYSDELDALAKEQDPRAALPLAASLGASYALLALGERHPDMLLSPYRLEVLLSPECAAFIRQNGEAEAVEIIKGLS